MDRRVKQGHVSSTAGYNPMRWSKSLSEKSKSASFSFTPGLQPGDLALYNLRTVLTVPFSRHRVLARPGAKVLGKQPLTDHLILKVEKQKPLKRFLDSVRNRYHRAKAPV